MTNIICISSCFIHFVHDLRNNIFFVFSLWIWKYSWIPKLSHIERKKHWKCSQFVWWRIRANLLSFYAIHSTYGCSCHMFSWSGGSDSSVTSKLEYFLRLPRCPVIKENINRSWQAFQNSETWNFRTLCWMALVRLALQKRPWMPCW